MAQRKQELSAQDAALLEKFEQASFGKLRKDFIAAIEDAASNSFGLEQATTVCQKMKIWLQKNPSATPAELFRALSQWIIDARPDEGYRDATRFFSRKLVDVFTRYATAMVEVMFSKEMLHLDSSGPAVSSISKDFSQLDDLKREIDALRSANSTLTQEKSALSADNVSINKRNDSLEGENASQKHELEQLRASSHKSQLDIERNKLQIETLTDAKKALEELRDRLSKDAEADKAKIRELTEANLALTSTNAQLKGSDAAKDTVISQLKEDSTSQKARIAHLEAELQQARQLALQQASEQASMKARLETAEKVSQQKEDELRTLRAENKKIAVEHGTLSGKFEYQEQTHGEMLKREHEMSVIMLGQRDKLDEQSHEISVQRQEIAELTLNASNIIQDLYGQLDDDRRDSVNTSMSNMSAASKKALGLDTLVPRTPSRQPKQRSALNTTSRAAPSHGVFTKPAAAAAPAYPLKQTFSWKTATPEQALEYTKAKCVQPNAMSEARFNAVTEIGKFIKTHLINDKGVLKDVANQELYTLLVGAIKSLVNNTESKSLESVYLSLKDSKPVDTDPSFNDFKQVLAILAVDEPNDENHLQSSTIYINLASFFGNGYKIREVYDHFKQLNQEVKANSSTVVDRTAYTSFTTTVGH